MNKNRNLLKPKLDVVFHSLFKVGNEDITKAIISDILENKIEKINLNQDRYLERYYPEDKLGILDIRAELNEGIICDIEVQLVDHKDTAERFLYYWSRLYGNQLKASDEYKKLNKTISILILDYELKELKMLDEVHTKWKIMEERKKVILTEKLELHIIEIPKAVKEAKKSIDDRIVQWMLFLSDPNRGEVKRVMRENKGIGNAMEKLEEISSDEELRRVAELREKYIIDEMLAKAAEEEEKKKVEQMNKEIKEKKKQIMEEQKQLNEGQKQLSKEKRKIANERNRINDERNELEREKITIINNMLNSGFSIKEVARFFNKTVEELNSYYKK